MFETIEVLECVGGVLVIYAGGWPITPIHQKMTLTGCVLMMGFEP